ncbi:MAG: xanthine dehydrogenase family protein subunit M [Deltaproteobacteria bacterium]|nr:xanthine dehydrogenase family protein subunit M [Deltaproteobacteria bacterium]
MHLEPFAYTRPSSLKELEGLLSKEGAGASLLAGGTDLLVLVKERVLSPRLVVDIGDLAELQGIRWDEGKGLTILAGTKISAIEHDPLVAKHAPALAYAAAQLGSAQVRHMATMAGNCCHGSPSAETPPVLLAHGAEVTLASAEGERTVAISDFWLAYRKTALKAGEYLKAFHLPALKAGSTVVYRHRGLRRAMEIDMVNVGCYLELAEDGKTAKSVRIAMGAVGPIPYRATAAEAALAGKAVGPELCEEAGKLAADEAKAIDDVRASASYRKKMVKVMVKRAFTAALEELQGGKA